MPLFRTAALVVSLATAAAATLLAGCVPLVVAGAVGGTALVATDRRSVGAQADDEAIELKISNAINSQYGESVHAIARRERHTVHHPRSAPVWHAGKKQH